MSCLGSPCSCKLSDISWNVPTRGYGLHAGLSAAVGCAKELEIHLAQPTVADWAVTGVGYVVLGALALAGLWLYLAWKARTTGMRLALHPLATFTTSTVTRMLGTMGCGQECIHVHADSIQESGGSP